jgi:hypothetical protein
LGKKLSFVQSRRREKEAIGIQKTLLSQGAHFRAQGSARNDGNPLEGRLVHALTPVDEKTPGPRLRANLD